MKLQAKLTKILGIKGLKENDIVTYRSLDDKIQFLCYLDDTQSAVIGAFGLQELKSKDLKLISRDFTLAEVLYILTKKIGIIHFTINMVNPNIMEFGDIMKYNPKTGKGMIRWIMFSQNKTQLTLFQQEQSVIDSISKIMGG